MTLSRGARLGAYEILGNLGAGGMGEVYRAEDANLSRQVAIKVLPAEFAHDAERIGRLEHEAKPLHRLIPLNATAICGLDKTGSGPRRE